MSNGDLPPEEFWLRLVKAAPNVAYELLCAAPSLAKWKKSAGGLAYLDHAAVTARSSIVGVLTRRVSGDSAVMEIPLTAKEIENDSKRRAYTIVNSPPETK